VGGGNNMSNKPSVFGGVTEEGWAYTPHEHVGINSSNSGCDWAKLNSGQQVRFAGHRTLERVEFRDKNYLLGEPGRADCTIIAGGECRIWFNDYQIYSFRYVELYKAVLKLIQVLDRLRSFPVPLHSRHYCESLIGRPIYYREFPAKILDFDGEQGTVLITAENVVRNFMPEPWADEEETPESELKVDLLSPKIWWFRQAE
jgi:hypothetical protein